MQFNIQGLQFLLLSSVSENTVHKRATQPGGQSISVDPGFEDEFRWQVLGLVGDGMQVSCPADLRTIYGTQDLTDPPVLDMTSPQHEHLASRTVLGCVISSRGVTNYS